jgi:hypothetical protein
MANDRPERSQSQRQEQKVTVEQVQLEHGYVAEVLCRCYQGYLSKAIMIPDPTTVNVLVYKGRVTKVFCDLEHGIFCRSSYNRNPDGTCSLYQDAVTVKLATDP